MTAAPNHRLLVVDDELTIQFALQQYLQATFVVQCASESAEALAMLRCFDYAAVIADLRLTGSEALEGLDIIAAARERSPDTRIILLSAYSSPDLDAAARAAGVDAVLRKPQSLRAIERCLGELFEARP